MSRNIMWMNAMRNKQMKSTSDVICCCVLRSH